MATSCTRFPPDAVPGAVAMSGLYRARQQLFPYMPSVTHTGGHIMAQSGRRMRSIEPPPVQRLTALATEERNQILMLLVEHSEAHSAQGRRAASRKDYAAAAQFVTR